MSVWPVTAWQTVCDHPSCTEYGPARLDWADALTAWLNLPGALAVEPLGVRVARASAVRTDVVTLCPLHAITVCCVCGTREDLSVTDLDTRRSWCNRCWAELAEADLPASTPHPAQPHHPTPERPRRAQPATDPKGIQP